MKILAVDTTTPSGSVAVLHDDRVLAELAVASSSTHSSRLLASIHFLLEALHVDLHEIDGFAVTPGPGSFTGIRIGLSTVKSFAFASGRPIAPVSSLKALAWKFRESPPGLVAPLLDAKKGEVYAALFEIKAGALSEIVPQGAYSPAAFVAALPEGRSVEVIGNGTELCRAGLIEKLGSQVLFSSRSPFMAPETGLLGFEILRNNKGISSDALEPIYFRKSQAEDKH